jgi:hypothetical protein
LHLKTTEKMPSGSCYCDQTKIFHQGKPIKQVRAIFLLQFHIPVSPTFTQTKTCTVLKFPTVI